MPDESLAKIQCAKVSVSFLPTTPKSSPDHFCVRTNRRIGKYQKLKNDWVSPSERILSALYIDPMTTHFYSTSTTTSQWILPSKILRISPSLTFATKHSFGTSCSNSPLSIHSRICSWSAVHGFSTSSTTSPTFAIAASFPIPQ
jgi:hypothetical protein